MDKLEKLVIKLDETKAKIDITDKLLKDEKNEDLKKSFENYRIGLYDKMSKLIVKIEILKIIDTNEEVK